MSEYNIHMRTKSLKYGFLSKYYPVIVIVAAIVLALMFLMEPKKAHAQKKLDLDDLSIKGELHNDDRMNMLARERNELKNYVKFRKSYKAEIVEELPIPEAGAPSLEK